MWHRIEHEQWQVILTMLVFLLTAGVFFAIVIRTVFFLKREKSDYLAKLPLEDTMEGRGQDG